MMYNSTTLKPGFPHFIHLCYFARIKQPDTEILYFFWRCRQKNHNASWEHLAVRPNIKSWEHLAVGTRNSSNAQHRTLSFSMSHQCRGQRARQVCNQELTVSSRAWCGCSALIANQIINPSQTLWLHIKSSACITYIDRRMIYSRARSRRTTWSRN